ncbi:hypothetical protein EJ03DRAFT_334744 [Teratosphaeria nubilosa]|uniref:Cyanovirin-N domain-containing protein n=1 Tax=Teratosphaeria nubilosa TaxID=161662 RepID=A0A6G1LGZ0_9PEZI|nr:hypothetical protein EJ03DRAFT_334744 [Teratosphaeria nubilosa]
MKTATTINLLLTVLASIAHAKKHCYCPDFPPADMQGKIFPKSLNACATRDNGLQATTVACRALGQKAKMDGTNCVASELAGNFDPLNPGPANPDNDIDENVWIGLCDPYAMKAKGFQGVCMP